MAHHVAVGALIGDKGILMVHRRSDLSLAPDRWSFPGGHLEPGETAAVALRRELREELSVEVELDDGPSLRVSEHVDRADGLVIALWVISRWSGTPVNGSPDENDEIRWVTAADLDELQLAHWTCRQIVLENTPAI